jgi:hypothetical protein
MANWNRFGQTFDKLLNLFPDVALTDFGTNGITGDVIIGNVFDRITRELVRAMPPAVLESLYQVDAEQVIRYAFAGQTTMYCSLLPLISGSVHLWRYPSLAALESPILYGYAVDFSFRRPVKGFNEIDPSQYTVNLTSGLLTLGSSYAPGVAIGERFFATYDVDVENALFAMPSLADIVLYGAAAELGSSLYSDGSEQWSRVTSYKERFDGVIEDLQDGTWVPDEIRRLHHWVEVTPKNAEVKSIRVHRG